MIDYRLGEAQLRELRLAHRQAADKREAYRINAVILLGDGWTAEQVAQALLIDPDTVRDYFKRYRQGGISRLCEVEYHGGVTTYGRRHVSGRGVLELQRDAVRARQRGRIARGRAHVPTLPVQFTA